MDLIQFYFLAKQTACGGLYVVARVEKYSLRTNVLSIKEQRSQQISKLPCSLKSM